MYNFQPTSRHAHGRCAIPKTKWRLLGKPDLQAVIVSGYGWSAAAGSSWDLAVIPRWPAVRQLLTKAAARASAQAMSH
jgi:hypothetical protein